MRNKTCFFLMLAVALCAFTAPAMATWVSFWGNVYVGDEYAPEGLSVGAYNSSGLIVERETVIKDDKTYYILDFETAENSSVYFKVSGANSTEGIQDVGEGGEINLNLSIEEIPVSTTTTVPPSTGGGGGGVSSGSSSSGGSGYYYPAATRTTTTSTTVEQIEGTTTTVEEEAYENLTSEVAEILEPEAIVEEKPSPGFLTGFATAVIKEPLTFMALLIVIAFILIMAMRMRKSGKKSKQ